MGSVIPKLQKFCLSKEVFPMSSNDMLTSSKQLTQETDCSFKQFITTDSLKALLL